ncbi:MAG TPA: acyl carrier protein [Ktedonobacteraceae bacterium]|nr:acyl carrier protein [Ktedonobacteraceae bacterium]
MKIEELVANVLELPLSLIKDSSGPATLKAWSSLKHIQLVAALEEAYGVTLTRHEIQRLTSLAEVRRILQQKSVEVGSTP